MYVPLDDGISLIASLMLVKSPSQSLSVSAYAASRRVVSQTETQSTPDRGDDEMMSKRRKKKVRKESLFYCTEENGRLLHGRVIALLRFSALQPRMSRCFKLD